MINFNMIFDITLGTFLLCLLGAFLFGVLSYNFYERKKQFILLNKFNYICMTENNIPDNIGNSVSINENKIRNEVDKAIRLIKSNTGHGQIVLSIYEGRVKNIKTTLSTDVKQFFEIGGNKLYFRKGNKRNKDFRLFPFFVLKKFYKLNSVPDGIQNKAGGLLKLCQTITKTKKTIQTQA